MCSIKNIKIPLQIFFFKIVLINHFIWTQLLKNIWGNFFHRHWRFTGRQGKRGHRFYSTLPLPPSRKHLDICLPTWHVRILLRIFNCNAPYSADSNWMKVTTLLNYHLIECMIMQNLFISLPDDLILRFC